MTSTERLFGYQHAFDHPVTIWVSIVASALAVIGTIVVLMLGRSGKFSETTYAELRRRCLSWMVLIPLMLGPVLLGAAWTMLGFAVLSILCYREFARASGLFRERMVSLWVVIGILLMQFAVVDHWYGFFMALIPLTISVIAAAAILRDHPEGYLQRVALGGFAFLFFGVSFAHLGYFANDIDYRPMLIMLVACVEINDVFAYMCGKAFGKRKLCPNTSPNKTIGGALGAFILTTPLVAMLGHFVFQNTVMDTPAHLIGLGMIVSVAGQLGDLMLSSVKRDLGVKDMGVAIPGHGGLLDRFDSLVLVAPAAFHYIGYFLGIGLDQPTRIISGG